MLNVQQEKFIAEFVSNGGNGTQAYLSVYNNSGEATARANASRLLRKPEIQARLKELQEKTNSPKILSSEELKARLSAIARREVTETVVTPSGKIIEKPASVRDSVAALQTLARISGLYINKTEIDFRELPVIIKDDV